MRKIFVVLLLLFGVTAGAHDAAAKTLSRIIRDTGLTQADFDLMGQTAETLYTATPPKPGKIVSWTNPDSKSHGTVRLAAMRKNCAYIQHMTYPKGAVKPKEIRLRMCKGDDGNWLLTP